MKLSADFHSHVLPGIDDGSKSVEMSLAMLRESAKQGITRQIASPHYSVYTESPEAFLRRREEAIRLLAPALTGNDVPKVYPAAEIEFQKNIAMIRELPRLAIRGTRYVLIEMPFRKWTQEEMNGLLALRQNLGLKPIVVHPERYLKYQPRHTAEHLKEEGIWFQFNAEYFLEEKKSEKMIFKGLVDLLGSDMHNTDTRCPNLGPCVGHLSEKVGDAFFEDVNALSDHILSGAEPIN